MLPQQIYRGRVRSGCLTCRRRKVKCDEARPVCNNCARLDRSCVYKARKTAEPGGILRTPTTSSTHDEQAVGLLSPPVLTQSSNTCTASTVSSNIAANSYVASVDSAVRLEKDLRRHSPLPPSPHDHDAETEHVSPATLISRDIQLTTTLDFLAAEGRILQLSSTTFVEHVECPAISPFDPVSWKLVKYHAIQVGEIYSAVALSINAISALHKAQSFGLSPSRALSLYEAAKSGFQDLLSESMLGFEVILLAAFLLCPFELIYSYGDSPALQAPNDQLLSKLKLWAQSSADHSSIARRLVAWFRILYGITLRGGGMGLISEHFYKALPDYDRPLPTVRSSAGGQVDTLGHVYDIISAELFDFYFQLQLLSGEMARLTHYHRSRTTGTDQDLVVEKVTLIKQRLLRLWDNRCTTQRQQAADIRAQLAPRIAEQVIRMIGLCTTSFHAEIIELDRVLGDPISQRADLKPSQKAIRDVVGGDWAAYDEAGKLDPGHLRPLFMYAIESMDAQHSQWATDRIADIRSPIYRSDFFSAFATALSSAQLLKDRRVTSKYFCISYFGVPPPFM